jgi:hypothetical protein
MNIPEIESPPRNTRCWVDKNRVCGGDCEAYDVNGVDNEQESACKLVNCFWRASVSWVSMARAAISAVKIPGSDIKPPQV